MDEKKKERGTTALVTVIMVAIVAGIFGISMFARRVGESLPDQPLKGIVMFAVAWIVVWIIIRALTDKD